jgi:hypothetical protein
MSFAEDIGSKAGAALGGAAATFFGQPELIPTAAAIGSQIGKFVGKKGEDYVIKGAKKYFEK